MRLANFLIFLRVPHLPYVYNGHAIKSTNVKDASSAFRLFPGVDWAHLFEYDAKHSKNSVKCDRRPHSRGYKIGSNMFGVLLAH